MFPTIARLLVEVEKTRWETEASKFRELYRDNKLGPPAASAEKILGTEIVSESVPWGYISKVLPAGKFVRELGMGFGATVYHYRTAAGKDVAVKINFEGLWLRDVPQKLAALKKRVPVGIAKHIPEIHAVWQFDLADKHGSTDLEILVVELLEEMDAKTKQLFDTAMNKKKWGLAGTPDKPENYEEFVAAQGPELEQHGFLGLIKAFEVLRKQFGIEWKDMKSANVMIRPSDKSLVFVDVGSFKLAGE